MACVSLITLFQPKAKLCIQCLRVYLKLCIFCGICLLIITTLVYCLFIMYIWGINFNDQLRCKAKHCISCWQSTNVNWGTHLEKHCNCLVAFIALINKQNAFAAVWLYFDYNVQVRRLLRRYCMIYSKMLLRIHESFVLWSFIYSVYNTVWWTARNCVAWQTWCPRIAE